MSPKQLKALRHTLRVTQSQLAKQLGVARNTVTRWEAGTRGISTIAERLLKTLR